MQKMMNRVEIIKVGIDQYESIINIWKSAELPYKPNGRDSKEQISLELQRGVGQFFIAKYDQVEVGVVLATHDGRKGWINRVAVRPEYRRKGIAKLLISTSEKWLEEQGIGIIAVMVESYNTKSLDMIQRLGYEEFQGIHYLTKRKHPEI